MRSKEFIREAGRNGSMDDFGQPINQHPTDAEYAARQAQGAKTGAAIKDFVSGTPKELKPAPANFPTIDPIARSNAGYLPATPKEIAAFQAATPYYGQVIGRDGLPINGGKVLAGGEQNVLQAAQAAAAPVAAAMPAYQARDLPDPRSFDQTYANRFKPGQSATPGAAAADDSAARAAAAALADRARTPIKSTEPVPAVKSAAVVPAPAPAPAPAPVAPALPQSKGDVHAGQGGTVPATDTGDEAARLQGRKPAPVQTDPRVYWPTGEIKRSNAAGVNDLDVYKTSELDRYGGETTRKKNDSAPAQTDPRVYGPTGEIIRPNALEKPGKTPVSDLDRYTRNDLPFEPYTGPEPKPDVKPNPNTTPIPRKVPKSVVQVSPDKQNLATTKTTLTPDEIKAAQEALRDPTIGPRDKAYYTELLKNQPAHPTNMSYDKNGKALFPMPSPFANQNAQPAPAGDSVVIKSGDTLSKIAAANGTTVQAIMALNPSIKDANRIAAGQTVKLRESSDLARIRHLAGLTRN